MIKALRNYIKNRLRERAPEEQNRKCLKVLGTPQAVGVFAKFYADNTEEIMLLASSRILSLCEKESFSSDEFSFYQKGVGDMADFFFQCWKEVEDLKKKD